jgi:Cu-Zn family superoxide dismutase
VSLALALALFAGAPPRADAAEPRRARALLVDARGAPAGSATFVEGPDGVKINAYLRGLPPGRHAIDLHAVGRCDTPDFRSAGPQLDAAAPKPGARAQDGAAAGDLSAVVVDEAGKGVAHGLVQGATLGDGPASLLRAQGAAIVVHASADGDRIDPAGSARDRIACGVIGGGPRTPIRPPDVAEATPPRPAERQAPAATTRAVSAPGKRPRR